MGDHFDNVFPFPTSRKAPYRNPADWRKHPLPANITPIRRRPSPLPSQPLPSLGYVVLAVIDALQDDPKSWKRAGGPDVLGHLQQLRVRWEADRELKPRLDEALRIILARRTGRI